MRRIGGLISGGASPSWTTTSTSGIFSLVDSVVLKASSQWPRGPLAPTSLTASAGNAQLSLSWTAPATTYGTITNYLVEYTASDGSAAYVLTNSTSTQYTLTGLNNGTSYSVRVAAVNFTAGDWSGTVSNTPGALIVTGGAVTTPGDGYKYHTFTTSGTLQIVGASLTSDVLVVGGGGQCDYWFYNSGGGGGGVLYQTNQTIAADSYSISVGNGGIANGGAAAQSSSFAGRVATGGGRSGAGAFGYGGGTGGASGIPTSASASIGNRGGAGTLNGDDSSGGGGGGAGGVGVNSDNYGGAGGSGITVFGVVYGKGGNGSGGGNGGSVSANRGAGANHGQNNGGSGVVIVRYVSAGGAA